MLQRNIKPGFTILELLIVIFVFGLVVTLGVISLNSARARMRDAQRISDINVLRSGLNQFWLENATYPVSSGVNLGAPGTNTDAFTRDGFVSAANAKAPVYLQTVPIGPKSGEYYQYKGDANGYAIRFQTERDTALGAANVYYLHSTGIDQADANK